MTTKKSAKTTAKKTKRDATAIVRGFKGFDKDLQCRGMQFVVGETVTIDGEPKLCKRGLHFCEYPLDVLGYYPPAESRYCAVETTTATAEKHGDDSKRVASSLNLGVEIGIPELVKAAIEYTMSRVQDVGRNTNSGYQGAASNSGDYGAASNSGDYGAASNSGTRGAASNSGDYGAASNSGTRGAASATGKDSCAFSGGYDSKVRGDLGCAICCVERDPEQEYKIIAALAGIVDGETLKPSTWYTVRGGKWVEVA